MATPSAHTHTHLSKTVKTILKYDNGNEGSKFTKLRQRVLFIQINNT